MEKGGPENTFGAYGNQEEMSFAQEVRLSNIFADYSPQSKTSPRLGTPDRKSDYSPSVLLDLRLENDRLKTQIEELQFEKDEKICTQPDLDIRSCLLAMEVTRLNTVVAEMAEKTYLLQKCLEEATRAAGSTERESELERQLDSLLASNQRNLEAVKYKKLSLEKTRKRIENLQAENVILKMALESTVMPLLSETAPKASPKADKLQIEYDKLVERYKIVEKQNQEQASFAKALDSQVTQMTRFMQECAEKTERFDQLIEENEKLHMKIAKYEEKIQGLQQGQLDKQIFENSMPFMDQKQAKKANCGYKLMNHLLMEMHSSLSVVEKDSSIYYDCELVRIRIQSLSRTVENMSEIGFIDLSETLKMNLVEREPVKPTFDEINEDIQALCKVFGQTIESFTKNDKKKQQRRTMSETKNRLRFDLDTSTTELEDLRKVNIVLQEKLEHVVEQRDALVSWKHLHAENINGESRRNENSLNDKQSRDNYQATETSATSHRSATSGNQSAVVSRLNDQLAVSSRQCDELTEINRGLRSRIEELEHSKGAMRDQLTSMQAIRDQNIDNRTQECIEELEDELDKVTQETCVLRTKLIDLEEALTESHNELKEKRIEMAKIKGELSSLQKHTKETSDNNIRKFKFDISALEDKIEEITSSCNRYQVELTSAQNDKAKLIDEIYQIRDEWLSEVKSLKAKNSILERDLDNLRSQIDKPVVQEIQKKDSEIMSKQTHEQNKQDMKKMIQEIEHSEQEKLRNEQELNKQLQIQLKNLLAKVSSLEQERDRSRESMIKLQTKVLDQVSASKHSECGTMEIEDMRRFVCEMKVESDYVSESSDLNDLKQKNQVLADQLSKLQQSTQEYVCSDECTKEKDQLEQEINQLKYELTEIEKTCEHMRDRLQEADRKKTARFEELKRRVAELEYEKSQLQGNLKLKASQSKILFYLQRQIQILAQARREIEAGKQVQKEMTKMFVSRIKSLKMLFQSEAEIAPRGTLAQIVKLREYNSNGATKMQSTLERVYDQLSSTRSEITVLKSTLNNLTQDLSASKAEVKRLLNEKNEFEKIIAKLIAEASQCKADLKTEKDAIDRERRQYDVERIELTRKEDHWEEERKRELQVQNVMKEAIEDKEREVESLIDQIDHMSDELKVILSRLEDSESKRDELQAQYLSLQSELTHRRTQLKSVLENKENLRGSENSLAYRVKELEATVDLLSAKLDRKSKEVMQMKDNSDKNKHPGQTSKPTDRVALIRSKIDLLLDKMNKTVKGISAAESNHYTKPSNGSELSPLPGKTFKTPLASSFGDDLDQLTVQYESIGKKYVNDAIDICQKSLKVFESMQTAHQRLCSRQGHN